MRTLLVEKTDGKKFRIQVPDDAKVTFGPWSPPTMSKYGGESRSMAGTLRIYQGSKENIIGCFTDVKGFRENGLAYEEEVVREEVSSIWKSDEHGYVRETKAQAAKQWVAAEATVSLPAPKRGTKKK